MGKRPLKNKGNRIFTGAVLAVFVGGFILAFYTVQSYKTAYNQYFQNLSSQQQESARNVAFLIAEIMRPYKELVLTTASQFQNKDLDADEAIRSCIIEKTGGLTIVQNFYFGREKDGKTLYTMKAPLPPGFDPRQRPWYRKAATNRGFVVTEPYVDAITGKLCLTLAAPVYQEGKLAGVLGLDVFLDTAQEFVKNLSYWRKGLFMVVDDKGYIIIHPDESKVGFNLISQTEEISETDLDTVLYTSLKNNWKRMKDTSGGALSYNDGRNNKISAHFATVPVWNWKVIASVHPDEINNRVKELSLFAITSGGIGLLTLFLVSGAGLAIYLSYRKRQLHYLATHDFLTGLPNRYFLETTLQRAVAQAKRGKQSALLFLDFDNFKLVNDTLGHAAGDKVLKMLADTLKSKLREGDLFARLGGDEFAVLLEETDEEGARRIAERLRRAVDESPVTVDGHTFNLSLSIGFTALDGNLDPQKVLSRADAALYAAKENGGNKLIFLKPEDDPAATSFEASRWVTRIKAALRNEGFVLVFQPVRRLRDGAVVYYEALLRLRGENGELVPPAMFIPPAERFGLMPQIDCWVVKSALRALQENPDIEVFINISAASLGNDYLLECIVTNVKESGVAPHRLGFEITETAVVKDFGNAEEWLKELRNLGCRFALDDFGARYSSFHWFNLLAGNYLDFLKIDGAFIRTLETAPTSWSIVQAMNTVAHALGKKTIAEWVENEATLKVVQEIGIEYAQGYYLDKPVPLAEYDRKLSQHHVPQYAAPQLHIPDQ
ncbi:MAG: EAL domain-containing protein [Bacillota bacterium]